MLWAVAFTALQLTEGVDLDGEVVLLQLGTEVTEVKMPNGMWHMADLLQSSLDSKEVPALQKISEYLMVISYAIFLMIAAYLCLFGLPSKALQHASVSKGCSRKWGIYLGLVYGLIYASTDQYVPNLPEMQKALRSSQALMTATVQSNWVVKALCGLLSAGLSDHVGRRPISLLCMLLLCVSSFCCASAGEFNWFLAARVLQGLGESFEPVVYAMVRDYGSDMQERLRMYAFLQFMALLGSSLAPFYGGVCSQYLGWRASFYGLSLMWALLLCVGCVGMVESCPDEKAQSYLKDIGKLMDLRIAALLFTEACIQAAYFTFNANCSYLVEDIFHRSTLTASLVMLVYGICCCAGVLISDQVQTDVLKLAKVVLTLTGIIGFVSAFLALTFPDYLWAYLVSSFLQACFLLLALVSTQVLFVEPMGDCAGLAASMETLSQNLLPALISVLATQSLIADGPRGLGLWQAGSCILAAVVFWLGYAVRA